MHRLLPVALILFTLNPGSVRSQDDPTDTTAVEIEVTTTLEEASSDESGASVTVITAEEIERLETRTVLDALRTVPGLDVVQSGTPGHTTSIFLRGTDSNQMIVALDGVPITDPYFGGYDFSTLSTEMVDRIEVVRGPFSVLYGSDAIGGVVNIITRRGDGEPVFGATVEGGSDGYGRAEALVSGLSDQFDYSVSGAWRDGDGRFENDDFQQTTGNFDVGWSNGDVRVGFRGRYSDTDVNIPFSGSVPTPWRWSATEETKLSVPFSHRINDQLDYEIELSRYDATFDYDDTGNLDFPFANTTDATADRLTARTTWASGSHVLAAGAEVEQIEVRNVDNLGVQIDDEGNDSWGLFVQDAMTFDRFQVTLGVRYDDHDAYGSSVSPRASLAYRFGDDQSGLRLRAGYGQAFRAPSVGELYFPFSGNLALEAEESDSWEAGIAGHWADGRMRLELTWFDTEVDQLIEYDFVTFTFENIGRATMNGLELSFSGNLGGGFDLQAQYTRLDATDETTGEALARRPDGRASLTLNWNWEDLNVNLRGIWVDDRPDIDPDLFTPIQNPSYTRVDLASSYHVTSWLQPFVRIENATDEEYSEAAGFPAPQRTFVGGLRIRLD